VLIAEFNAFRSEDGLHRAVLGVVREVIPTARAAIILVRADGELRVVHTGSAHGGPVQISKPVVKRALAERKGILARDMTIPRAIGADETSLPGIRSLLCVPIPARQTVLGAIYLVASEHAAFDDDHLQLVTSIARVAAIAMENGRQMAATGCEAECLHPDRQLDHNLVGESPVMRMLYERLGRVARADTTVLITGETGTGKELAARAIHVNSGRARRPFIAINCAALTETLLESELFGHERGAFTGAMVQKKGRLELADGGTLFLDEIGELAPALQSKLLRVLQEREFERVGGTRPIKVDIRLISATNRSLAHEVNAGRFREDLYFRLNVVTLEVPPLRERVSDIPILAHHFLSRYARKARRHLTGISPSALDRLNAYDWPGNVRELENAIERAAVLGSTEEILPDDLPEAVAHGAAAPAATREEGLHAAVLETKKRTIAEAFRASGGSYTKTARTLNIHPNYLHRLVRNLGLRPILSGYSDAPAFGVRARTMRGDR
jgi:Nif-specific regulatory protein